MKENNELTRDDIAIDHDMEVDCDEGREIAVYIETWFDVDKKFHIDTASDDDTWLNMYGRYNPFDDTLRIECNQLIELTARFKEGDFQEEIEFSVNVDTTWDGANEGGGEIIR